jgi:nitrogen fixation/metabolism regulation signal transduction histidine kinase
MNDCEVLTREYVLLMEQHSRDCVSENRYVASLRGLVAQYRELIVRYDKVVNDFNNGVVNVQRAKGDADTMYQSLMDIRNSLEEKYTLMMNVYQVSLLLQAAEQATAALPPNDSCG